MRYTRRRLFAPWRQTILEADSYTPTKAFFKQYNHPIPQPDVRFWGLSIGGAVKHPLVWSYADLRVFAPVDIDCTLLCASNEPGGERIGHARWRGVPLASLLNELEIAPQARYARLESADGHNTSVPLNVLHRALVALEMNGAVLTPEQGFPARLIIPGLYDHKQPRRLTRLEFVAQPIVGRWEQRGYDQDGEITTAAAAFTLSDTNLTVGRPAALTGYAFAGLHPIEQIEISIDGGAWTPVTFEAADPGSWTRWRTTWHPPAAGTYQLSVRAAALLIGSAHTVVVRVRDNGH